MTHARTREAESGPPTLADQARLQVTRAALANFCAALEMWRADHKIYPARLDDLVPNYLRHIPAGPEGSPADWEYHTGEGTFQLQAKHSRFAAVGLPDPHADSTGVHPGPRPLPLALEARLALPPGQATRWRERGWGFERDGHHIVSRLAGPFAFGQRGDQWVEDASTEGASTADRLEHKSLVSIGELSGVETVTLVRGMRSHSFYLSDEHAGWVFEYIAPRAEFCTQTDAMFVEMIRASAI